MARRTGLRSGLVSQHGSSRLGSLQLWILELGWPVGLDLGGLCAMGLCALSLRTLGVCRRRVGLVPWTHLRAAILWPGVRRLCRRGIWLRFGWRLRRRNRLVPAGIPRTVPSLVSRQWKLFPQREHHEYADHERKCAEQL